jgi:hypothetical protein
MEFKVIKYLIPKIICKIIILKKIGKKITGNPPNLGKPGNPGNPVKLISIIFI